MWAKRSDVEAAGRPGLEGASSRPSTRGGDDPTGPPQNANPTEKWKAQVSSPASGAGFHAGHPNPHIRVFEDMARSEYAFGYPKMPMFSEASRIMLVLLESVLRNTSVPEEALRLAQQKADAIVADYQEMAAKRAAHAAHP